MRFPDPISSHILDTSIGQPASGVAISLEKFGNNTKVWEYVTRISTILERSNQYFSFSETLFYLGKQIMMEGLLVL